MNPPLPLPIPKVPENSSGAPAATSGIPASADIPLVPDHELLRCIGRGSYGEVWLARSVTGAYRAVKVVRRGRFEDPRPFEREFEGIQRFEPVSRLHSSQVAVLHVGRNPDYFYYIMELADDANAECEMRNSINNPHCPFRTPRSALHTRLIPRPTFPAR